MNLVGVPSADVPSVWPFVSPTIDKVIKRFGDGRWTADDVYEWLLKGEMQLWTTDKFTGVCVTQILLYPTGLKELLIWLAATETGHITEEMELFDRIVKSAKNIGCNRVVAYCRRGLLKKLNGWKIRSVQLVKEI